MFRITCTSVLLLASASFAASAATFNVTRTADTFDGVCDDHCSLREAIHAANTTPGADTVRLQSAKYYRLSIATPRDAEAPALVDGMIDEDDNAQGDLDIADDVLILGRRSIVDANQIHRVIDVLPGAKVEIRDLEVKGGLVPERGAGIANAGILRLTRVKVLNNLAASGFEIGQGGGIFNEGRLVINYSNIENNRSAGSEGAYGAGGGVYNVGSLYMNETLVRNNVTHDDNDVGRGGGLYNTGFAKIDRSFFNGNGTSSSGNGGAILNINGGKLELLNTTVSGNFSGEDGGAVSNGAPFDQVASSIATLRNVTVADNNGGGLYSTGSVTLLNTIVAGNYRQDGFDPPLYTAGVNCIVTAAGSLHSVASLIGTDGNCSGAIMVDDATVLSTVLYPLQNNGGRSPTHALRRGFAIDAGSNEECTPYDQRSTPRPFDGDYNGTAVCDIGAFERSHDD